VAVPKWYAYVAASRLPISRPTLLKPFKTFNQGKKYKDRIKPFGFVLSAHTVWGGCPTTAEPARFHLVRLLSVARTSTKDCRGLIAIPA
jgi:hypothetical protein